MTDFPTIETRKWEKDPRINQLTRPYEWRGVRIPLRTFGNALHGFLTDFRSGGRIVTLFIPKDGRLTPAWINHDHRYAFALTHYEDVSRKAVDDLMYKDLRACGASWLTAKTAWLGVRIGGHSPWSKNRKRERCGVAYEYHYAEIKEEKQ